MNQKLAIAVPIVALVPAFFPIYLHFSEPTDAGRADNGPAMSVTSSPGFNCDYASKAAEHAICQSDTLAKLDVTLNAKYSTLTFGLDEAELEKLTEDQNRWRAKRDQCRRDQSCIEAQYKVRIETLTALIAAN